VNILITGGDGFVGSGVVDLLIENGHSVVLLIREGKNKKYKNNKLVKYIEAEIGFVSKSLFLDFGEIDILIDFAWDKLDDYNSLDHFECELPKHYAFIRSLVEFGLKSVVVTGTCLEYGNQSGMLSENFDTNPNTSYGYAKDSLRRQLEILQNHFDFSLSWLRLFYIYGDRDRGNDLFSQLKKSVNKGDKIFNMSDGRQVRDFVSNNELSQLILKLSLLNKNLGIVNVCSGTPISVKEIVDKWIIENNWSIELNRGFYTYTDYEPFSFWGDNKKLKSIVCKQ